MPFFELDVKSAISCSLCTALGEYLNRRLGADHHKELLRHEADRVEVSYLLGDEARNITERLSSNEVTVREGDDRCIVATGRKSSNTCTLGNSSKCRLCVLGLRSAKGERLNKDHFTVSPLAGEYAPESGDAHLLIEDRKSTRLNSSHSSISYA